MTVVPVPAVPVPPDGPTTLSTSRQSPTRPAGRLTAILASHSFVDAYSALVPALLGLLEVRCGLTMQQSATLLGVGSICSGLAQPLTALFNDRFDSRVSSAIGLAVCAVCLSSIGWIENYSMLLVLYACGMVASGMFHPAAAATAGHLGGARRSLAVSLFFVAGMTGWGLGNLGVSKIVLRVDGFRWLALAMVPGLVMAVALFAATRRVAHRVHHHNRVDQAPGNVARRWWMVGLLFVSAALRFSVNMSLMFLCVRYVQQATSAQHAGWDIEQVATHAAPLVGRMNASMIVGMGLGGLLTGLVLPAGREKWPMVLLPLLLSPSILFLPRFGLSWACVLSAVAGFGFAATVPTSTAVAQRLLPHRTSLASALMLGGAWTLAFIGPQFSQWGVDRLGVLPTYACVAAAMAASGLVIIPLRTRLIAVDD